MPFACSSFSLLSIYILVITTNLFFLIISQIDEEQGGQQTVLNKLTSRFPHDLAPVQLWVLLSSSFSLCLLFSTSLIPFNSICSTILSIFTESILIPCRICYCSLCGSSSAPLTSLLSLPCVSCSSSSLVLELNQHLHLDCMFFSSFFMVLPYSFPRFVFLLHTFNLFFLYQLQTLYYLSRSPTTTRAPRRIVVLQPSAISRRTTHLYLQLAPIRELLSIDQLSSLTYLSLPNRFDKPLPLLPTSLTHLTCGTWFNTQLPDLPPRLIGLTFGNSFNQPTSNLPLSLRVLVFGDSYNQPILHFPPNLTHLTFGLMFQHPLVNLPAKLTHLHIPYSHNLPKDASLNLPSSLVHFSLYSRRSTDTTVLERRTPLEPLSLTRFVFDFSDHLQVHVSRVLGCDIQSITHLPPTITHLFFCPLINNGLAYNMRLAKNLPFGLQHLTLGRYFDQPVENLPSTLTYLKFGYAFKQPVDNLPPSLLHISFGYCFNKPVDRLSRGLLTLSFDSLFIHPVDNLPRSLVSLSLSHNFNHPVDLLPASLLSLSFGYRFNQTVDDLPSSLTHLTFGNKINAASISKLDHRLQYLPSPRTNPPHPKANFGSFNLPLNRLPLTLTHLCMSDSYNHSIYQLPPRLTHLWLGQAFDQPIKSLPPTLRLLSFGTSFNQQVDKLPDSLLDLTFGDNFNQRVHLLPPSLTHLHFGASFNYPLTVPRSLLHLTVGSGYSHPLPPASHLAYCCRK